MRPPRAGGLAATLAVLALPAVAAAAPITTTLRVEGASANIIPETQVTLDDDPAATVTAVDTVDGDTITVPAASATAQIAQAARTFGIPFSFTVFPFGSQLIQVGSDSGDGAAGGPFWRLNLNHVASSVGADAAILQNGESVTWAFVPATAAGFAEPELDLTLSSDAVQQGATFRATVTSTDGAGTTSPAAGATVAYCGQAVVADGNGTATLVATGIGTRTVLATRPGEVRSQARAVCSFTGDPTVCSLPPLPALPPAAVTPLAPAAGQADTVAPGSAIALPASGHRYRVVRVLRGTAGPDRSDVGKVEVAVERRVGTLCRFLGGRRSFSAPRSCALQRYWPARANGSAWIFKLGRPLPPGSYRAWSRATDGAGNRESTGVAGVNSISLPVIAGSPAYRP